MRWSRLARMTETYSSGTWIVRPGEEDDFVTTWKEFIAWASGFPGSGTFRLVRDLEQTNRFVSFGAWESLELQRAWRQDPEFSERLQRVRQHCEDFQTSALELVTEFN